MSDSNSTDADASGVYPRVTPPRPREIWIWAPDIPGGPERLQQIVPIPALPDEQEHDL